jgi:pimeloyl-ACP methyl ester carboxylesterase
MLNRTLLAVALVCLGVTTSVDAWAEDSPKATQTFIARDTIAPQPDDSADARACIDHLIWKPGEFKVTIEPASDSEIDGYIRFPSPKPNGVAQNDLVALEWYAARDEQGRMIDAPAVVVVHESGSGMDVGRLFAKAFHAKNLHAFMIQLPFYGLRRPTGFRPDGRHVEATMVQGIADVRRARDAVAVIPHIIRTNIALQGTSLGGFVAATTAGLDHGYQSVHIMVAGGDLHSLVTPVTSFAICSIRSSHFGWLTGSIPRRPGCTPQHETRLCRRSMRSSWLRPPGSPTTITFSCWRIIIPASFICRLSWMQCRKRFLASNSLTNIPGVLNATNRSSRRSRQN